MSPAEAAVDLRLLDAMLARAHDVAEIKVVLQVVRLAAVTGSPRVALMRLLEPESVRSVAGQSSPEPGTARVLRAVEQATADGLLHRIAVRDGSDEQVFVLPATPENTGLVERLRGGVAGADADLDLPPGGEVTVHRPNVFSLYEQQIGPLTPLIAEHLREAERAYPREWLEGAIRQAAEYNARNWRYVETILQRWEAEGGPTAAVR